jgi:hypothetical protein
MFFLRSKKDRNKDAMGGLSVPTGSLIANKISFPTVDGDMEIADIMQYIKPNNSFSAEMNEWKISNIDNINRGLSKIIQAEMLNIPTIYGVLWAKKITKDDEIDYGIVSMRVVTDVGVAYIVDAFQNSVELENMKYHGIGTGSTAENVADTELDTELTTEYSSDNTRATGTTIEGATANIYRTVATNTLDSGTPAIVEHGIFSQAANSGGVLLDRSVFSVINLNGAGGDGLQTTYDLTLGAGS